MQNKELNTRDVGTTTVQESVFLKFLDQSREYCVGMVDIVNSTHITAGLSESQIGEFYRIFLNAMDTCVRNFGGITIKNMGDGLLFAFPDTPHTDIGCTTFKNTIECCMNMLESDRHLRQSFEANSLPFIKYRISVAYGPVRVAKLATGTVDDIFGLTVNRCAKMNRLAPANGLIIDELFYNNAKLLTGYHFWRLDDSFHEGHKFAGYIVSKCRPE